MKVNRNLFWKVMGVFAVLDLCLLLAGCGDWETQAINIINLLGPAVTALLQILVALGVAVSPDFLAKFNNWAQQAETALTTIKGLVAQYKAAVASAQAGIIGEIQSVLSTVASNFSEILSELHITNPETQARVTAVFAAIQAMFAAVLNLLPAVQNSLSGKEEDPHKMAEAYSLFKSTAKNFKATFNAAASYFGKQYEI